MKMIKLILSLPSDPIIGSVIIIVLVLLIIWSTLKKPASERKLTLNKEIAIGHKALSPTPTQAPPSPPTKPTSAFLKPWLWFWHCHFIFKIIILLTLIPVWFGLKALNFSLPSPISNFEIPMPNDHVYLIVAIMGLGMVIIGSFRASTRTGLTLQIIGILVMYATVLAALFINRLFPPSFSFVTLGTIATIAFLLAIRQRSSTLAHLALIGAMASPILSGEGVHSLIFSYLTLLNTVIVILAYRLAWLSLALSALLGSITALWAWTYHHGSAILPMHAAFQLLIIYYMLLFTGLSHLWAYNHPKALPPLSDHASLVQRWHTLRHHGLTLPWLPSALLLLSALGYFSLQLVWFPYWESASALLFAWFYAGLAMLATRQQHPTLHYTYSALTILLSNLALALAWDVHGYSNFWALGAVFFYLLAQRSQQEIWRLFNLGMMLTLTPLVLFSQP